MQLAKEIPPIRNSQNGANFAILRDTMNVAEMAIGEFARQFDDGQHWGQVRVSGKNGGDFGSGLFAAQVQPITLEIGVWDALRSGIHF